MTRSMPYSLLTSLYTHLYPYLPSTYSPLLSYTSLLSTPTYPIILHLRDSLGAMTCCN